MSTGAWARRRGLRRHAEAGGTRSLEAGAQPLELATSCSRPRALELGDPAGWQGPRARGWLAGQGCRALGSSHRAGGTHRPRAQWLPAVFRSPPWDLGGSKSSWGGYRVAKFCFYRICFSSAFI